MTLFIKINIFSILGKTVQQKAQKKCTRSIY